MAAIGCTAARVYRRPRCGVVSTGDELVSCRFRAQARADTGRQLPYAGLHGPAGRGALVRAHGLVPDVREALQGGPGPLPGGERRGSSFSGGSFHRDPGSDHRGSGILRGQRKFWPTACPISPRQADHPCAASGASRCSGFPGPGHLRPESSCLSSGSRFWCNLGGDAGAFDPGRLLMRPGQARGQPVIQTRPARTMCGCSLKNRTGSAWPMPRLGKSGLLRDHARCRRSGAASRVPRRHEGPDRTWMSGYSNLRKINEKAKNIYLKDRARGRSPASGHGRP